MEAKEIIYIAIGLLLAAYLLPAGLSAVYSTPTSGLGYTANASAVDDVPDQYSKTLGIWQFWNGTAFVNMTASQSAAKEDSGTISLFKLIPLFAVIVVVLMLIFVALKEI